MSADVPTWGAIVGAIGFFILVSGSLWGIWWRIEGKVEAARKDALAAASAAQAAGLLAQVQLAEYKTHAAENFATKAGMQEQTQSLLRAIEGLGTRIDSIAERIDNIILQRPTRRS